jgi:hypothetical protein
MNESLNEVLFHLLWTKDKVFDSAVKVLIPHTIIYQYYQPRFWYFTSVDGSIRRKSKEKLTNKYIDSEFLKKPSSSGIIAILFYIEDSKRIIDYLPLEKFSAFLQERKTHKDMILQKFVDPAGDYNISYSILWTTNFCLFEKKQNKLELNAKKFDLYERAVTFEGKEFHVTSTPVRGSTLPNRLMKTADSIVSHVAAVTFEKMRIVRMVLQIKVDSEDRLWFICATNLRFLSDNRVPLELNTNFELPKEFNINNLTIDTRTPAKFMKSQKCASCLCDFEPTKVIELTYETIFHFMKDNPTPIFNLHPKVSKEDILRLKQIKQFLLKKAWMCFNCYINFIEPEKTAERKILPKIGSSKGKSRLTRVVSEQTITSGKISSLGQFSSRSSAMHASFVSPSMLNYSNPLSFSTRTSKTAGGDICISFQGLKDRSNK